MSTVAWRDEKYRQVYDENYRGLRLRREKDATFTIAELEGILKHLYVQQGNDWLGRGELGDVIVEACIDAHERFLNEWRAEKKD